MLKWEKLKLKRINGNKLPMSTRGIKEQIFMAILDFLNIHYEIYKQFPTVLQ
jgi:hypothetical protein